jgi:CRP-like cAMP-binding protein
VYLPVERADAVFLLVQGRVKICHITPDGKQSILALIEPGELFGELALYSDGEKRDEYAEAAEDSTVVMIDGTAVHELMQTRADLSLGISKLIGMRRRPIERRLRNLLFLSNRERLTHLLLELVERYGRRVPRGIELTIRLSHQELANIIGSTRETVTVVLGEMPREQLVEVARRKLIVCDLERLAASVPLEPPTPEVPSLLARSQKYDAGYPTI